MPARYPVRRSERQARSRPAPNTPAGVGRPRFPVNDNRRLPPRAANSNWAVPAKWRPFAGLVGRARGLIPGLAASWIADELHDLWKDPEFWAGGQLANPEARLGFAEAGWTNNCSLSWLRCTSGQTALSKRQIGTNAFQVTSCVDQCNQAVAGNVYPTTDGVAGVELVVVYQVHTRNVGGPGMASIESWGRDPGTLGDPAVIPAQGFRPWLNLSPDWIAPVPSWVPSLDPFSVPLGVPAPIPGAIPFHVLPNVRPNPHRHPSEQPGRGPAPRLRPRVRTVTPGIRVIPSPSPEGLPTIEATVGTGTPSPRATPRGRASPRKRVPGPPRGHKRAPPSKRTRDRKWGSKAPGMARGILKVVHGVTELNDFVNSLWDALPTSARTMVRGQRTTPFEKAMDIFDNLGDLDLGEALENLAEDEAEDRVFGFVGSTVAAGARRSGWPSVAGPQSGPWDQRPGEEVRRRNRQERQRERDQRRERDRWNRVGGPPR